MILENLISIYPSSADAHNSIAVAYKYLGQFDKARSHFDIATQCNSTFYSAYRNRSLITDYNSDLEHFNAIQSLYQEKSLTDNQVSVQIGFAYARALEQRKDFRLATDVLVKANNAHLDQITPFNTSLEQLKYMRLLRSDSLSSNIAPKSSLPPGFSKPIFVVGMPRSGTSLVETILTNDNSIASCDELIYLERSIYRFCSTSLSGRLSITQSTLDSVRSYYYYLLYQARPDVFGKYQYHVDKMPCNFRFVNIILKAFPGARVVYTMRHPLDNILSMYREFFASGLEYSYSLDDSLSFYLLQHKLMQKWLDRYPSQIFTCSYESLVTHPSQTISDLCDYLCIPFSEHMLHTNLSTRSVRTASSLTSRRPISSKSIGSWRRYESLFHPLIKRLEMEGFHNL